MKSFQVHIVATLAAALCLVSRVEAMGPIISPGYQSRLSIDNAISGAGMVTQMAWGPDGRLYASRFVGGAVSFRYDAATGLLDDMKAASEISGLGIAFAPGRGEMYLSSMNGLWRLTNTSGSGQWGSGAGDVKVQIVSEIPTGNHAVNQLQIQGNTLYVGIGTRTYNGGTNNPSPPGQDPADNAGESAYNGTISWIRDLSQVANTTDAARVLGAPNVATIQNNGSPFTTTDPGKLAVHSAGARNPYGLALDAQGSLFLNNNYHRALTNGDGTVVDSPFDQQVNNLALAVHDQLFKAQLGGDYGYRNDNWRGLRDPSVKADVLDPANPNHLAVRSITPDNLWNTDPNFQRLHDPANPVGLGPSSSSNGLAFWSDSWLPEELRGNAFIARWTEAAVERAPGTNTLIYQDLVAADPTTGQVRRVAQGFDNPLAVLNDGSGRLLVSDFGNGRIYRLSAVPEPSPLYLGGLSTLLVAGLAVRRRLAERREARG
jgi:glucose/arabinose dehydrogenase